MPFDDILASALKSPAERVADARRAADAQRAKDEQARRDATPVPPIAGHRVNGVKYVKVADVIGALESTGSAVRVAATLRKYEAKP